MWMLLLLAEVAPIPAAGRSTLIALTSSLDTRLDMAGRMTALFENVPKPRR